MTISSPLFGKISGIICGQVPGSIFIFQKEALSDKYQLNQRTMHNMDIFKMKDERTSYVDKE